MGRTKGAASKFHGGTPFEDGREREHETLRTGEAPPMQFPQERIREQRITEGRMYADAEVAKLYADMWHDENVLGRNLAKAREAAGYTQKSLAETLDVHVRTIKRYESGDGMPDVSQLRTLSIVLGVSTDWLLGLIDSKAATLLDYYEFSTPSQQKYVLKVAAMIQDGKESHAADAAARDEKEFLANVEKRMERI